MKPVIARRSRVSIVLFSTRALAGWRRGDYREAVNYFRRYQRLESSPSVNWEAGIAIAYVKMLPQSPYYNWRAAHEAYLRLMREQPTGIALHENIALLRETLAILVDLHLQINDLGRGECDAR